MIPYQTKRVVSATMSGWVKKYCGYPVGVVAVLVKDTQQGHAQFL